MPGGGNLRVQTASVGGEVLVRFADSGHGLPQDDLAQIFEPFYTTKAKGTGLGLSVSYGIVAAHGGRIDVESAPGRGAVFTVRLPLDA
jgi:signal transduction histidine kinase